MKYEPQEPFLFFFHCGEWIALLAEYPDRPWEIRAALVWCRMTGRTAQEWSAELEKHEVPGMHGASWDRRAAHMVWEQMEANPRLRPGERQGDLFG